MTTSSHKIEAKHLGLTEEEFKDPQKRLRLRMRTPEAILADPNSHPLVRQIAQEYVDALGLR